MARYSGITPEGTCDLLFRECEAKREVEEKVVGLFKSRGYSEVMTPSLEYYDVFSNQFNAIPQEMMYKFIDSKGRILVMRPDSTMPIARLASTKLRSFSPPLRLFYNQKVYRVSPSFSGRRDEVTQCGIELLGASGKKPDLEIIETAVAALKNAGTFDFRVEIGHVDFYKSIIDGLKDDGLPFDRLETERIRGFIEAKNYAALRSKLEPFVGESPCCRALLALPKLFGGDEVFGPALSAAPNRKSAEAVRYLRELYAGLCGMGLKEHIMVDLGLVNQIHYYSGVVFRGFMQGSGETVLSGGRYDSLLSAFGSGWPAIGFAVNTDAIAHSQGGRETVRPQVIIYYAEGFAKEAFEHMENLVKAGTECEMSVFDTLEETRAYALKKGIGRLDAVGRETEETELNGGAV